MLFDWAKKIVLLGDYGQKKIRMMKKIGDDEKMIAVKMIQTKFRPDGTEKHSDRVSLHAGITYALPSSVAEILIKEGSAEKVE